MSAPNLDRTIALGGLVLLDELNTCPPQVQGALLRVFSERAVGGVKLNDRVRFIAAMNPPAIAIEAGGNPIAPALANRLGHYSWTPPSVERFNARMMRVAAGHGVVRGTPAIVAERIMLEQWDRFFVQAAGDSAAFLEVNSDKMVKTPKDGDALRQPYPVHRTWEDGIRALAASRYHYLNQEETWCYVGAHIGEATAQELRHFLATKEIPDAAAWLRGEVTLDLRPTRADVVCAVLRTAVALLSSTKDDDLFSERVRFLMSFFTEEATGLSDLVSGPMKDLFTIWRERIRNSDGLAVKMAKSHGPLIEKFRSTPAISKLVDLGVLEKGTDNRPRR